MIKELKKESKIKELEWSIERDVLNHEIKALSKNKEVERLEKELTEVKKEKAAYRREIVLLKKYRTKVEEFERKASVKKGQTAKKHYVK